MNTEDETKGEWKVYAVIIVVLAFFIGIYVYGYARVETQRQSGARTAKAVVIEKNFAPGQSVAGIASSGSYGIGSTFDRYIVAVRATEGATGIKEIDVPRNVYYRLSVGAEVRITITRGDDLADKGKFKVEIDPSSIPAQPPAPAPTQLHSDDVTNGRGQIRK